MKRYGGLYDLVASEDNLYEAYLAARIGKRKKWACFEFETNLYANLAVLKKALIDGSYRPRPYHEFMVYEPKPRLIYGPAFCDVVVQHAVYRIIYPIFDRSFISTTYACRRGCGTHKASDYAQWAMRRCDPNDYYLQIDVRKYFYSINRDILFRLFARKIKDERLLALMALFADLPGCDVGIPVGNLLSQLYANIYLNGMDHYAKRYLKLLYYARYVDDAVVVGLSLHQAMDVLGALKDYLRDELALDLSKWRVALIKKGINFVGYRTWRSRRYIRKMSLYKFNEAINKSNQNTVNSLLGHAKHTSSLASMKQKVIQSDGLSLPKSYCMRPKGRPKKLK